MDWIKSHKWTVFAVLVLFGMFQFTMTGNAWKIGHVDEGAIVAKNYDDFVRLNKYLSEGDKDAVGAMVLSGKAFVVDRDVKVQYKKKGDGFCLAVVEGGFYDGESWIVYETDIK